RTGMDETAAAASGGQRCHFQGHRIDQVDRAVIAVDDELPFKWRTKVAGGQAIGAAGKFEHNLMRSPAVPLDELTVIRPAQRPEGAIRRESHPLDAERAELADLPGERIQSH